MGGTVLPRSPPPEGDWSSPSFRLPMILSGSGACTPLMVPVWRIPHSPCRLAHTPAAGVSSPQLPSPTSLGGGGVIGILPLSVFFFSSIFFATCFFQIFLELPGRPRKKPSAQPPGPPAWISHSPFLWGFRPISVVGNRRPFGSNGVPVRTHPHPQPPPPAKKPSIILPPPSHMGPATVHSTPPQSPSGQNKIGGKVAFEK